jgi:predicted amidohydrolase
MKIALCQMEIIWENKEKNKVQAESYVKEALCEGAELVCFPEMTLTGFSMNTELTAESCKKGMAATVQYMTKLAASYEVAIGFGWVEGQPARNHYTILEQCGHVLSDYIKIHPFRYGGEYEKFVPGEQLVVCQVGDFKIGTQICYDLRFPEAFQVLAEQCDLILVPAAWPGGRREHWKCLLQARAIENQVYVAGINTWGDQGGLTYTGDSCIFAPDGRLCGGFLEKPGILCLEIEQDVDKYRKAFPMRQDRRWNLYKSWIQDLKE